MVRLAIGMLAAGLALGQGQEPPSFEVASIKASELAKTSREGNRLESVQTTPGSVTMRNATLKSCMAWAYHVFEYQISGPAWMGEERYDVMAKAAHSSTEDELRSMLQTLLAQRFELSFHRQTKEMSVYLLVVGKSGPKFQESKSEGESNIEPQLNKMSVVVQRVRISFLVEQLSRLFQTPIVDTTGLTGRYDVTINIAKYLPQSSDKFDPLGMIQQAMQEELGLKLEPKKAPVDLLIVDHAEKLPVEN